jgi:hypothetical protein
MKSLLPLAFICLGSAALGAQEVQEPRPLALGLALAAPLHTDLGAYTGSHAVLSPSIAYAFWSHPSWWGTGHSTLAAKLDSDCILGSAGRPGATGVGLGLESTHYFRPGFTGVFLSVQVLEYEWSFPNPAGTVPPKQRSWTLTDGLSIGYRFDSRWSVAATLKDLTGTHTPSMNTLGLGVQARF